jgi:membrane protease YdiL (CAAX protease family)
MRLGGIPGPSLRSIVAVPVYLVVALLSFWPFGDHGVTAFAVLVAAALNLAFGFAFGWRSLWVPILVFGAWYLSVEGDDACENCGVILNAGAYSLLFAIVGAAARPLTTVVRRRTVGGTRP